MSCRHDNIVLDINVRHVGSSTEMLPWARPRQVASWSCVTQSKVIVKNDGGLHLTRQGEYTGSNRIVEVADVNAQGLEYQKR
jgi:hypothetical protein